MEAIRHRIRVVLHQYHSPNSDTVLDRVADPIGFSINMKYLYAFEPENRYDMRAIEIHASGSKPGYIAQADNHVSSTLIVRGHRFGQKLTKCTRTIQSGTRSG